MHTTVMLLAGRGKRFADAGYILPKPLIEVDGVPMIVAATRDLPKNDKLLFVVSGDYIKNHDVDGMLKKYFPDSEIVVQTVPLQGQAHSALQAEEKVDPECVLTVGACDSGMVYNHEKFQALLKDPGVDAIMWAFRNYPPMESNPTAYGWIDTDLQGFVKKVQYKVPLSDKPLNDYAVFGSFTYKKAKYCFQNAKEMIAKNLKSGAEFSLDECTNVLVKNGLKVKVFEVDVFKCWGTPNELRTYLYWQNYFENLKHRAG